MSGGQYGSRGYLYQVTVSVLESFLYEEWDYIEFEPNTQLQKVDVRWIKGKKCVKSAQVKSSKNNFEHSDINSWLLNLIYDDKDAEEFCLLLVGTCSTKTEEYIKDINEREISKLPTELKSYSDRLKVELIKYDYGLMLRNIDVMLHEYFNKKGYSPVYKIIDIIKRAIITDFIVLSAFGKRLSKVKFECLFQEYINSFYIKEKSEDLKQSMYVYQKENEVTNLKKKRINSIYKFAKGILFVVILLVTNLFFKPLSSLFVLLRGNNLIPTSIFCIFVIAVICVLIISDKKFQSN